MRDDKINYVHFFEWWVALVGLTIAFLDEELLLKVITACAITVIYVLVFLYINRRLLNLKTSGTRKFFWGILLLHVFEIVLSFYIGLTTWFVYPVNGILYITFDNLISGLFIVLGLVTVASLVWHIGNGIIGKND